MKWMVFKATILQCKAILGLGQPGLIRWILFEWYPWCRVNSSACWPAVQYANTVLQMLPTTEGEIKSGVLGHDSLTVRLYGPGTTIERENHVGRSQDLFLMTEVLGRGFVCIVWVIACTNHHLLPGNETTQNIIYRDYIVRLPCGETAIVDFIEAGELWRFNSSV